MNVVFIVFRRPELTERAFSAIAKARPSRLFVVADGPRDEGERKKCEQARQLVENVDWNCEVSKNYSDVNLGCKLRVSSGLDWVFDQVEDAIILEDDCLPHPSFFRYCAELLDRYRADERVMHISGDNFQAGIRRTHYSYYFSMYPHVWGWATWRRAWKHYDGGMSGWPAFRESEAFRKLCPSKREREYWTGIFDGSFRGEIDAWSYAWTLTCWVQGGLSVLPCVNLVSNIGFGESATHTHDGRNILANVPTRQMESPVRHPDCVEWNESADDYTFRKIYLMEPSFMKRILTVAVNKYTYGKLVRQLPIAGPLWAKMRCQKKRRGS